MANSTTGDANMKLHPVAMQVEVKIGNDWTHIEEPLPLAEHARNANTAGATELRTLDRKIHMFLPPRRTER